MIIKNVPAPEEVCHLIEFLDAEDIKTAAQIADYCQGVKQDPAEPTWTFYNELLAVYAAGYIAGKRTERAHRNKNK